MTQTLALRSQAIPREALLTVRDFSLWYGDNRALDGVTLDVHAAEVLAFIGPSGCGKSTLLRAFNRMNDGIAHVRTAGVILFDGIDLQSPAIDPPVLRRRFGWVAQRPNPFAWSVRENIAYGPRLHGVADGAALEALVRLCLERAGLSEELAERLDSPAADLSLGQQQRLCIARALATDPDILLMDEPCGSLDPIATARIETLIRDLGREHAVVIVTHNMEQARRVADRVAFLDAGRVLEIGPTERVFTAPASARCAAFLTGAFG